MENQADRGSRATSDHAVQLFDTAESVGDTVAAFLSEGVTTGDALLVVARGIHLEAITSALAHRHIPVQQLIDSGQLKMLDAVAVLRQLLLYGMPEEERFSRIVGDLVRSLVADGRHLRIYGEMVDVLAEQMEFAAVVRLEELWNALSDSLSITLLCGYASAHFAPDSASERLREVGSCHDRVVKGQSDMLGNWILAQHAAAN
jgi:hypothetical protein